MKIKEGYVLRDIAGESVVIPIGAAFNNGKSLFTLNESGAFLWKLLEADTTAQQLVEEVLKEYDVARDTAEADVLDFLAFLTDKGIIA